MMKKTSISLCTIALATALLAGCSSASTETTDSSGSAATTQSASASTQMLTIEKDPATISDALVTLPIKRVLIIKVDQAAASDWTGTVEDASIAEFIAGTDSDAPMIKPLAEGDTTVTLTSPEGQTITFNLSVTPGAR